MNWFEWVVKYRGLFIMVSLVFHASHSVLIKHKICGSWLYDFKVQMCTLGQADHKGKGVRG